MNTNKGRLLDQISELLTIYVGSLDLNNSINRLNQNIDGEDLACGLLNRVFGWKLENLNKKKHNYPGIDLGDFENRICVQVTSDTKRNKIETTLNLIEKKGYDKDFDRVIFMYLSLQKPKFKKKFDTGKIQFDPADDCISMKEIFTAINNSDVGKIDVVAKYLNQALKSDIAVVYEDETNPNVDEEEERIKRLCLAKLRSLGVDELIAWDILKNTTIDNRLLVNEETEKVRFFIGGFGSGKSHQLYCLFLKLLSDYKKDETNLYFPVFIEAKCIKDGELEKLVSANVSCDRKKIYLLVDGLDEMPLDKAVSFVEDLDIIVNSYDYVRAIVSTRPSTIIHDREQIDTRSLSIQEINELYCLINNVSRSNIEYRFNNKKALLNTLSKPFCAVVFCLYAKKHRIFNEMEFVRIFIEKTVEKIFIKNPTCEAAVKELAIKAVDNSYGTIDKSEVDVTCDLNALLSTGLFVEVGRTISFSLPVTAQWIAATAIREKYIGIDEIIDDEDRLFKWIYPFSILFNRISFSESKEYFVKLMKKAPGIATLIARAGEDLAASTVSQSKKMNGEQLYYALSNWLNVFRFCNIPYISNGMLNTISFNQIGSYIIYGLRREHIGTNVEVTNISLHNTNGDYLYVKRCGIKSQATWPWIEALDFITAAIVEDLIKKRGFLLEDSILEDEYIWSSSLKLLRTNHFVTTSIEVKKMVDYLKRIHPCDEIIGPGLGTIDYRRISVCIDKLDRQRKRLIKCPYIQGTQSMNGVIWSQYSAEEMKNYIEDVYEKALNVYKKLIDSCFSSIKMQMGFYQLLPARMVGFFEFKPNLNHGPYIMWGLIPCSAEERSTVSLEYGDTSDVSAFHEEMYDKVKKLDFIDLERPYMSYSTHAQVCYNNTQTPVTDIVYEWLKNDLKRIGLIKDEFRA